MAVPAAEELLVFLQRHGFLAPAKAQQLAAGEPRMTDSRMLARVLVERDWLTPYQANQLLQGRGGELLLGPYRIIDRLGSGGMGQVFKAHHASMDRLVALKIIPKEHVSNAVAVARFQREVRAVAKLAHPNIVIAFEVNQAGDTHFLAMEYVEGLDLARLVQQSGPLPVSSACEYIRQAAVGLQHAHEKGLVHRDIKPGNLMVTRPHSDEPPIIKILDFGLARFESERGEADRLTQLDNILGTVDYIAPEQAQNARKADIRADIYSLGCSLFYLLTGQPPFRGDDPAERIRARLVESAPSICEMRPEISRDLERMLERMLARHPADRYQTPVEVAKALEPFTERQALSSRPRVSGRLEAPRSAISHAIQIPEPARSRKENEPTSEPRESRSSLSLTKRRRNAWLLAASATSALGLFVLSKYVAPWSSPADTLPESVLKPRDVPATTQPGSVQAPKDVSPRPPLQPPRIDKSLVSVPLKSPNPEAAEKKSGADDKLKLADAHIRDKKWEHLDLAHAKVMGEFLRLLPESHIKTKELFTGPIDIVVVAKTHKNDIRLHAFNGACVIFNWVVKPRELRVNRPDGTERTESGSLTTGKVYPLDANRWYTLRWQIAAKHMWISVDGTPIFSESRPYNLSSRRPVFVAAADSIVDVKSVEVTHSRSPSGQ